MLMKKIASSEASKKVGAGRKSYFLRPEPTKNGRT